MRSTLLFSCVSGALFANAASDPSLFVNLNHKLNSTCNNNNGVIEIDVAGGTPPYTYLWSDASTMEDRTGLAPGLYSVTVTDAVNAQTGLSVQIDQEANLPISAYSEVVDMQAFFPCPMQPGSGRALIGLHPQPPVYYGPNGVEPYNVGLSVNGNFQNPGGTDMNGNPWFAGINAGDQVEVFVSDANGCNASFVQVAYGPPANGAQVTQVYGACGGQNNGGFAFTGTFDFNSYCGELHVYNDQMVEVASTYCQQPQETVEGLAAGDYTVEITYGPNPYTCTGEFLPTVTIPDLGVNCGEVNGTVFLDHDQDCVQDPEDIPLPYRVIEIQPGPEYAITSDNGTYARALMNGTYTLAVGGTGVDLYPLCPAVQPAPFTIAGADVQLNIADSSLIPLDLVVHTGHGTPRPGFTTTYWNSVENTSGQWSGVLTVTFTFDPLYTFVGAAPAPDNVSGNVVTWTVPPIPGFGHPVFQVNVSLPPDPGLIGSAVTSLFVVDDPVTETSVVNNTYFTSATVQGSYDPNDKTARTSSGSSDTQFFIDQDSYIDYTIRFQNTGTDTAFTVVVTDTLSADVDMATFEQSLGSHPFHVAFKEGRVVEWRFDNIDLPDSGTNELESHGLVQFRIKPVQPLLLGTIISNNADIFFDFNPPVRTNDAELVAEMSTNVQEHASASLQLFPNPAQATIGLSAPGVMRAVEIYAPDGRRVFAQQLSSEQAQLYIGGLSGGHYAVVVRLVDGTVLRDQLIKY